MYSRYSSYIYKMLLTCGDVGEVKTEGIWGDELLGVYLGEWRWGEGFVKKWGTIVGIEVE